MNLVQRLLARPDVPQEGARSFDSVLEWLSIAGGGGSFTAGLNQTWTTKSDTEEVARNYESYAMQLFSQNPVVFSAVMTRLAVFSQARLGYRRFENGRPQALFGDQSLRMFERPWPGGTISDLLGKMLVSADLGGNAFVWNSGSKLHVWRPDWVNIVLGSNLEPDDPWAAEDVEVVGYLYRPGGEIGRRSRLYYPDEVTHFAPYEDPQASFRGMSWLTPVIREIQADSAATEHKWQFFNNGATPNMVVKFDPSLDKTQAQEFKDLMESEHQGVRNAYKTLYLGGGADATVVGADFQQLDFKATQGKGETRIAMASGVPATILGASEGLSGSSLNAGNYGQAKRLFSDVTLQHLWGNAVSSLETLARVPDGAELWFDTRSIPFLQDDLKDTAEIQQAQAAAIRQLVDGGYDPASVVAAIQSDDFSLLNHTGKLSVQLQEPGTDLDNPGTEDDA